MNHLKSLLILFSVSLLFHSCEKIDLGEELSVKIGERLHIDWELSFKIDSINDYRCPMDVNCIWAGDVDIFFDLGKKEEVINLYNRDTNPFSINGYTIEIIDVEPYPLSYVEVDPKDVIIKIKVEKE